jgi:hypothetical protein
VKVMVLQSKPQGKKNNYKNAGILIEIQIKK